MMNRNRLHHIRKKITRRRLATRQDRIMTLANFISISRILLAAPLIWALENDRLPIVIGLIVLIVVSDLLDGMVARLADEITHFGKLVDPIADKVCMMVIFTYLIFEHGLIFAIFFLMLAIRDIVLVSIGLFLQHRHRIVFQSIRSGKWFVGMSALTMFLYLIDQQALGFPVYLATLALLVFSTIQYIQLYRSYLRH